MAQQVTGKTVLILSEAEASALNALLYEFAGNEAALAQIAHQNRWALGRNHIETLAEMWNSIHLNK